MEIVFIYESNHPVEVKDGLYAALEVLRQTFSIRKYNLAIETPKVNKGDFILAWGAFGSKADVFARGFPNKKGLCIAGCTEPYDMNNYDVLFYETKWYREKIKWHPNIVQAFGINTDIYYNMKIIRDIDYLGVGAFATWKHWEKFLNKKGSRMVIGEFQKNNSAESQEIWDMLEEGGVVCKDMITPEQLNVEYNRAKTVYLPAEIMGGGERAVLEARQCGCEVEVENPKLKELLISPIWTHLDYAKRLREGIQSIR